MESISENNGIGFLLDRDKKIYCAGISTGGSAEIKMAHLPGERQITATTLDPEGAEYAKQCVQRVGLGNQIAIKIEDVAQPLPYSDGNFDYIYARLILHYLPKDALKLALAELYRVLRTEGRIFVVVRSADCPEACGSGAQFDPATCLTTYSSSGLSYSRYFHTQGSIQHHLSQAGFTIKNITSYQEQLCVDFQRKQQANQIDHLIEVLAVKP